jgi:hypothetical protein
MNVGINEPGEDEFSGSIDHRGARWRSNIAIDASDGFAFAVDICLVTFAGSNDFAVLDQQGHKLHFENNHEKPKDEPQIDADLRR